MVWETLKRDEGKYNNLH